MQIDVLVKNEKHVKLKKNIGRIFRQYNIIEYKSPEDGSGTGRQRHILPHRDAIPIQLVIVQKLSKEHNYWLNNFRNDLKAGSEIKKITESGLKSIDNTTITHSSVGDFTYNPKTGAVSKMKGGGHGQANIEFLEANGLEYNIVKVYDNGVRIGNIPDHKVKAKRTGTNQSWFPESWSESDIANAGAYIGNLLENVNAADGVTVFGNYNGVRVGVIRTNGRISTIFPDATSQP